MQKKRQLMILVVFLAIAGLACQATSAVDNQTAPAQDTTVVLFEDDFSDSNSGWEDFEDSDATTGYRNGGYQISINVENWYYWVTPGKNFTDVVIDVDALKQGGPDNNEFGVICRYKDDANFYFLSISSDGYYAVSKFIDGESYFIGMDQMLMNDKVIKLGNQTNHMKASCIGENLTLTVNGSVLADVKDSEIADGDVGLIASTFDEPGTDILYDNFIVSRP